MYTLHRIQNKTKGMSFLKSLILTPPSREICTHTHTHTHSLSLSLSPLSTFFFNHFKIHHDVFIYFTSSMVYNFERQKLDQRRKDISLSTGYTEWYVQRKHHFFTITYHVSKVSYTHILIIIFLSLSFQQNLLCVLPEFDRRSRRFER